MATLPSRPRAAALLILCLIALSFALSAAVVAALHPSEQADLEARAAIAATGATRLLHEHAARVFDAGRLILDSAAVAIGDDDPRDHAEDQALYEILRRLSQRLSYVRWVAIVDATGQVAVASGSFPAPAVNVADRGFFQRQMGSGDFILFGPPQRGRLSLRETFVMSRRLPGRAFRGLIAIGLDTDYFRSFYRALELPFPARTELVRSDGVVLADRSWTGDLVEPPRTSELLTPAFLPAHDLVDTAPVGDYEVAVAVEIDRTALRRQTAERLGELWRLGVACCGTLAAVAALLVWRSPSVAQALRALLDPRRSPADRG